MTRRIIVANTVVVVLTILLFALPLGVALEHRQRDQDLRELTQLAALAASRVDANRFGHGLLLRHPEREQRLGVYDLAGRRVDGDGPATLERASRSVFADRVVEARVNGNLLTAVPVIGADGVEGAVRAAEPLASGRSRVRAAWARLALLAVLTASAALLVALTVARRLTSPLVDLVGDAKRIGDGDFTASARMTGLREVDQVAAALTATAARLSDLVAKEQAFTADASHQLRSPLAALRLTIEGELAHPRPEPDRALGEALVEVERLEATISELLELARETSVVRSPIDLGPTLDRLARRWEGALANDRRRFVFERGSALPPVRVSDAAVSHVLDVLIANARDHGEGDVVVGARAHHGAVSISVADGGRGIAHPERLFARRQEGAARNGIGLALARRLAEAEGGRLILKQPREPTTFELTLPAN